MSSPADAATPKACPSCAKRYPADALFCSFDGAPLTTTPGAIAAAAASDAYVGCEIGGHIELRQLVGIGAMGKVYRAFQKGIDRDVAVKILHRELSANQTLVARFHREAKVASRLAHPNVVHVLLTGQLPDGAMYIVMEYLDGLSLQSALAAAGGVMPLPRALHIALQLCDAAGEAHIQGVVHRDLKPENIMLVTRSDDPDYVKVLDFGIARLNWADQSMATAAGLIFGTARYISPEGAQGERVGPQGDVYSIATMVYQMLAGRTPFDADQAVALLVQQIHDAPLELLSIPRAAYVPEPIAEVVMKNLAKRPEERAESARALGRALLEAALSSGLSAQDLLAHPAMLASGRGHTSVVQMPSMLRTRQLQLAPDDAARLAATTAPPTSAPTSVSPRSSKTDYETPLAGITHGRTQARTEMGDATSVDAPPSASTVRWGHGLQLEPGLVPPPPPSSSVDLTMDDQQLPNSVRLPTPSPPESTRTQAPSRPSVTRVDSTLSDESADLAVARAPDGNRSLWLVGACFLAGAVAMGGAAYKLGLVGTRSPAPHLEASSAPSQPSASEAVVLDAPSAGAIPPLAVDHPPASGTASAVAAHAAVELSTAHPAVGQPVDLIGRVAGAAPKAKVEGPRFSFVGPGVAPGTEVSAVDDGSGAFRASFAFLQTGRFEVAFLARVDGAGLRSVRSIVVGSSPTVGPVALPPTTAHPPSAPTGSGTKWM